jgi:hypothetical protein
MESLGIIASMRLQVSKIIEMASVDWERKELEVFIREI